MAYYYVCQGNIAQENRFLPAEFGLQIILFKILRIQRQ